MNRKTAGLLLALLLPLAGCVGPVVQERGGYGDRGYYGDPGYYGGGSYYRYPAPSHGHWRWDDDLRVYISVGYPLIYYYSDRSFWRWESQRWVRAYDYRGPWPVARGGDTLCADAAAPALPAS